MDKTALVEKINQLRKERNALILAHNYVASEIQEIADFLTCLYIKVYKDTAHVKYDCFHLLCFLFYTVFLQNPKERLPD